MVATVDQHARVALAFSARKSAKKKDAERRDKESARGGEDTLAQARLVKTFRRVGDIKNGTADL